MDREYIRRRNRATWLAVRDSRLVQWLAGLVGLYRSLWHKVTGRPGERE